MTEEGCYAEEDGGIVIFDCAVIFDAEYALVGDVSRLLGGKEVKGKKMGAYTVDGVIY